MFAALWWFFVSNGFAGDCTARVSLEQFDSLLAAVEGRFADEDLEGFYLAVGKARESVPCLRETVTPQVIARLHRIEGLTAFVDEEEERAIIAFAAARSSESTYRFPPALVAESNPIHELYLERDPLDDSETISRAENGELYLDGLKSRQRPTTFPVLLQVVEESSGPNLSSYLWPKDVLPYTALVVSKSGGSLGKKLLIPGIGATAVGAGLLGGGLVVKPKGTKDVASNIGASKRNDALRASGASLMAAGVSLIVVPLVLNKK